MVLNLWGEQLSSDFMQLYNISPMQMCNILERLAFNDEKDNVTIFCEETGLKLDEINVVDDDLEFIAKIVSTTIDDCDHLKRNGLIPIDVLLEQSSPIQQHLKSHQIEIYPSTHELFYKGERYSIPLPNNKCEWCIYNESECLYIKNNCMSSSCDYRKAINRLSTKLYSDKAQIEMFLISPIDEMLSYSVVNRHPEMLLTIDDFIRKFFKDGNTVGSSWKNQKQYSYIVTFPIKYNDMSYRNNYIDNNSYSEASNTLYDYEEYCKNNYYDINQVPKCFWDNVWLIRTCLSVIGSFGDYNGQICAGIKHEITIPYDKLNIEIIPNTP